VHAVVACGVAHRGDDAVKHSGVGHTMMRLRAEEEFDVARAIAGTTRKHFVGYAMEVVRIDDRVADDVVGFEKRAQIREVEEFQRIFIIVRRETVLPGQLDCRGCGNRSFKM
jgi:hypothetical protein